ncbi:Uncharacterised protein r2_g3099 [Pycnogonum litorale]
MEKVKEKLSSLKTTQGMIPGGLTSLLQPLDVVLNKPFKDRVRKHWMSTEEKELTKGGNLKKPGLSLVTSWVKTAWEDLPAEMVVKSFLKTGIANKMDGTEDDHLWQDEQEQEEDKEEATPAAWDTDEKLTQEEWEELFGKSDDEEFDGF